MKYYHLTSEENLDSILKEGLKCMVGENSTIVGDKEKVIYLSDYNYLDYWSILLDRNIILEIDSEGIDINNIDEYSYGMYKEIIYSKDIQPQYITIANNIVIDNSKAMRVLCTSFIYYINRLVSSIAKIFTSSYANKRYNSEDLQKEKHLISKNIKSVLCILNRLDYSVLPSDEIKSILRQFGDDGEYTFCDTYMNTDKRLWEQLLFYDAGDLSEDFRKLHDCIKNTFKDCLYTHTGGWTD